MYEMSADRQEKLRLVRIALKYKGIDSIHMEPIILPDQVHLPCHNLEEYRLSTMSKLKVNSIVPMISKST